MMGESSRYEEERSSRRRNDDVDAGGYGRSPPRRRSSRSPPPRKSYRRSSRSRSPAARRYSRSPAGRRGGYSSRRSPPPRRREPRRDGREQPEPSNVLGAFGLSFRTTEDDLRREFSRFGNLEKVALIMDKRYNESRGFGFVTFSTVEEATEARNSMNDSELDGRRIRVDFSVTQKPHEPTPGSYAGRRGGSRSPPPRKNRDRSYSRSRRDRSRSRSR